MAQREIGNLRTRLSWEDEGAARSLEGFRRDLRGLRSEMNVLRSQGREYTTSLKGLRQQADILNRTYKTQQERVRELRRRYEESVKIKGEDANQTRDLNRQYNNAVAEMNRTERQLKEVTEAIENQINPWRRLSRNMETAGQRMQTFGRGMSSVGRTMTMRVTTPILGVAGAALKVAADFEEGMSRVQAISGATGEELAELESLARELGATTRFSATDAAGGMEFLAMAGFEVNEIMAAMPGLLDLAASSNMDLGRAADIASNILSGFGLQAAEAGRVSDVLAAAASSANTNVEQLGNAMSYVAPVAATLGLNIEEVTAAVGFMSDAGIQGEKAGTQLRMGLLRLANPTKEAATLMERFGIDVFDAQGNMLPMPGIIEELSQGLEGMGADARTAALATLFGAESTAGWSILLDRGADELANYTKELENSEGAAAKMAKTMEDNTKGSVREFQSAAEEAGIAVSDHLLPVFTDMVERGTELIRRFGELDDSTQKNIIRILGLAAALGPAAVVAGNLTTAVGGLVRVGGRLSGLLGRKGGSGLLGRIGLLGLSGGPVGLAITGISLLGTMIGISAARQRDFRDVNLETVESLNEEANALETNISRFEELQNKNKLSNDEMARFVDLMTEMQETTDEKALEKLRQEYEQLLEKSGLTNDEMSEFVSLNEQLASHLDESNQKITENGNALVGNVDALKDLNEEQRERIRLELEAQAAAAEANMAENLRRQRDLQREINELNEKIPETKQRIAEQEIYVGELAAQYREAEEEGNVVRAAWLAKRIYDEGITLQTLKDQLATQTNQNLEKQEQLDKVNQEIEKLDQVKQRMIELELSQVGINAEKGKELQAIDREISKLQQQKRELDEKKRKQQINNEEYRKGISQIDGQISKLRTTRQRVQEITSEAKNTNRELGRNIDKKVTVDDRGTAKKVHDEAQKPATKRVTLSAVWSGVQAGLRAALRNIRLPGFAEGTNYAPGGLALVGEEGFELARLGNRWSMLDFGIADIPRGTQIFTHDESKKIIQALNNLPAYANGASFPGETDRIVRQLNDMQSFNDSRAIALLQEIANGIRAGQVIVMDERVVGRIIEPRITEIQERNKTRRGRFAT